MTRRRAAFFAACAAVALLTSGCTTAVTAPVATKPPLAFARPADGSTLSPAPPPSGTPVDPSLYATTISHLTTSQAAEVRGVDFVSRDGNIGCSILDPAAGVSTVNPWAGCQIAQKDFAFPSDVAGPDPSSALSVSGKQKATARTPNTIVFPGTGTATSAPVRSLPEGASIAWSTISCIAIDNGIRCTNTASDHGFFVSRIKYELF